MTVQIDNIVIKKMNFVSLISDFQLGPTTDSTILHKSRHSIYIVMTPFYVILIRSNYPFQSFNLFDNAERSTFYHYTAFNNIIHV